MSTTSQRSRLTIILVALVSALAITVAVLAGVLIGRNQPQATIPTQTASAEPTPPASSPTPETSVSTPSSTTEGPAPFDPANYNTAVVTKDCKAGDFSFVAAQAGAGTLTVRVELTDEVRENQQLEILLATHGDELYEVVVTYLPEYNSTHLWDGEDEDSFLPLTFSLDADKYEVEIPLSELEFTQPIRLLVNRWTDSGDGITESCSDQPLIVE